MGGATVNFSLQDAHGPGSCSFVGIPNPKVVDVVTDPAGLADTPSIDIAGTGSIPERLVASVTDPSSGVHSRAFVISAMRITPNNEPPVPLIVEPFGGDQEVPAGEVFNPVGVRVLNANTLEPVEGVFEISGTASVPVDTVLPPDLPTTVYDRDHPLRPWGPRIPTVLVISRHISTARFTSSSSTGLRKAEPGIAVLFSPTVESS